MTREGDRPMDIARLRQILDAYGADPGRWPVDERPAAERLIAQSTGTAALLEQAAALDGLMALSTAPAPTPELMARVLADREPSGWLAALWPFGPFWQPVSAMAAAGVLGIVLGVVAPDLVIPDYGDNTVAEVESLALGPAFTMDDGL